MKPEELKQYDMPVIEITFYEKTVSITTSGYVWENEGYGDEIYW